MQFTETEQKLVTIWAEILKTSTLTVHDDFIDLGGDSLAAMLCLSRLRTAFGVKFDFEDFFGDHATIAEFAAAIDQSKLQADES